MNARQIDFKDVRPLDALGSMRKVAFLGDSITARALSFSSPNFLETSVGYATWVKILTNQRFYSPPSYNLGVNGRNTNFVISLDLANCLALKPDVVVHNTITNDVANDVAASTTMTNLTTIWDAIYAAGATCIQVLMLGRDGANIMNATEIATGNYLNQWIRQQALVRKNFFIADCGLTYDDPASATWAERNGYSDDGLHSNNLGAPAIAQRIVDILNVLFPVDWMISASNAADLYDVTNNKYGNLVSNGMMQGTSGSISGGLATGNVATGWTLVSTALGGATCVASKSTLADGRVVQQIDFSGTYTGNNKLFQMQIPLTAANFAANDVVDASAYFELTSPIKLVDIVLSLQSTESGTTYSHKCGAGGTVEKTTGFNGILKVPPRTILSTPSSAFLLVQAIFVTPQAGTPTIGGTIKLGSASVRKNLPVPT